MGDPLWYYGDFSRPDHWGHWTMFFRSQQANARREMDLELGDRSRDGISKDLEFRQKWASMPYNGVGGVFRIRPDGTNLRSFARGLRNPCGLCFDKNWNLFTNDNDHKGIPSQYAPGRLMHVTEGSYWSWPRGWMQSKTPDRADIFPMVNDDMGRAVPVLQTYYADGYLPERYENNLFVTRWCRRQVSRFPMEPKGNTFTAKEHVLLDGRDQARPVGICVGRGGRVFVTVCYMAQNEGSPAYRSDLAVITRKDDTETMPFAGYDATVASLERLLEERNNSSWSRSSTAFQELLRRWEMSPNSSLGPRMLRAPLASAISHFLLKDFGAGFAKGFENEIESDPQVGIDRLRDAIPGEDPNLIPDRSVCLGLAEISLPKLTAARCRASEPQIRLGGVLTAGFRLTMPAVDAKLHPDAPLTPQQKEDANIILYADEREPIDLRTLGRVGNYTVAEHWKALKHTNEQEQLFSLLMERLDDDNDRIRLQAAHFLSLLNDSRSEPKIARVVTGVHDRRLDTAKLEHVKPVWMLGPIADVDGFEKTVHPIENAAVDLSAAVKVGSRSYEWKVTKPTSPDRPLYDFRLLFGQSPNSSVYSLFRFDCPTAQRVQLLVGSEDGVKVWQNGTRVFEHDVVRPLIQLDDVIPLDLQTGSNDILVRVGMKQGLGGQYLHFRHLGDVRFSLQEKPDGMSLADRLRSQRSDGAPQVIDEKFVQYDWSSEVKKGDTVRGMKLFGAESLGCIKCHAGTPTQAGGGGPSLADAGKRFTVPYLVESVLSPSKVISPVFKSTLITTHEGKVISGLVVSETGDKVELLLPDTKRIAIEKSQIDERKFGDVSTMPVGLIKTPEELRDVIAYLLSNPTE